MGTDEVCGLDHVALGLTERPGRELLVPEASLAHDAIHAVAQAIDDLVELEPGAASLVPTPLHELLSGLDGVESAFGGSASGSVRNCVPESLHGSFAATR